MKDVLEYSLKKLKDAYQRLEEGVKQAKDELDKDGVIQRFEFTFELIDILSIIHKIFLQYLLPWFNSYKIILIPSTLD